MSRVERERFEELKEAYALEALDESERREVEDYLRAHPERQPEIDDLTAVTDLLALAPEELEPSPKLRNVIMTTVRAESRVTPAASRQTVRRPLLEHFRGFVGMGRIALGAAAVVLIGLLSWNTILQRDEIQDLQGEVKAQQSAAANNDDVPTIALKGSGATSGAKVEVVRVDGDRAVLVAKGLRPIDKNKTLQIWVIKHDVPKPSGIFEPGDKLVSTAVKSFLKNADTVAVTVEPAGGSPAPTTDPVLAAKL